MKRLSCADLIPLLRPPLSAQAVSILGFGRIETGRDPLIKVNSPMQGSRFLQIELPINRPRPQMPPPPLRNAYALGRRAAGRAVA